MPDSIKAASVAAGNTLYSFDKLYDYLIPPELEGKVFPGCRVKISFGHSLRQGIVMDIHEAEDAAKLKPVSMVIDREPVLSAELLKMAAFMKSRCYCTYFEACRAMLPTGLSVKLTYSYSAVQGYDSHTLMSDEEKAVYEYLRSRRTPVREDRLLKKLEFSDVQLLGDMVKKGYVLRSETVKKRIADETVKMIRLRGDIPDRKYTPNQTEVLSVLSDIGEASVKEICYFTGVSSAVTDNLVKRGICEYFEAPPPKEAECPHDVK